MTLPVVQCATCRHFFADRYGGNFCDAFPDRPGIPRAIIIGEHDHHDPYPGDHGIRYESVAGAERWPAPPNGKDDT